MVSSFQRTGKRGKKSIVEVLWWWSTWCWCVTFMVCSRLTLSRDYVSSIDAFQRLVYFVSVFSYIIFSLNNSRGTIPHNGLRVGFFAQIFYVSIFINIYSLVDEESLILRWNYMKHHIVNKFPQIPKCISLFFINLSFG